jgi:uncharacterized protein (TIGR02453 family)
VASSAATDFTGFPESGLRFLTGLKKNNDRTWFNERKQTYLDDVQAPLHALVTAVNEALKKRKIPFASDPRRLSFRIYRDTRFSGDKSPYKTHASAVMYRRGNRETPGVLYMHIDPAEPFLAAGFHMPDGPQLRMLRAAMAEEPKAFLSMMRKIERAGISFSAGDPLTRLPRGFEKVDDSVAVHVKRKSIVAHLDLERKDLLSAKLVDRVAAFAEKTLPLLDWGWSALDV